MPDTRNVHRLVVPVVWLAALTVTLASCADSSDAPDLAGRSFVSTSTPGHELVEGTTVTIEFGDDTITARAGCNTLTGGATWTDGTLDTSTLASTAMGCEQDLADQDMWLSTFLAGSPALELSGSTLTLGDDTEGIVLEEAD